MESFQKDQNLYPRGIWIWLDGLDGDRVFHSVLLSYSLFLLRPSVADCSADCSVDFVCNTLLLVRSRAFRVFSSDPDWYRVRIVAYVFFIFL